MMSSTWGAPFGGTTCGGQYGLESLALRLMTPPNFGGGGGRYFPSIVVVAPGDPGTPVIGWPWPGCGSACSSDGIFPVATTYPRTAPSTASSKPRSFGLFN